MKKFLLALLLTVPAFGAISDGAKYKLNNNMGQAAREADLGTVIDEGGQRGLFKEGHQAKNVLIATYDVAVQGGASLVEHETGVSLPDGAIITRSYIDIVTALTGGGTTIAVKTQSDNDIKTATAVGSWGIGILEGQSTGSAATMLKMTAERGVRVKVANSALTAGKFNVYIEYVMGE